MQIIGSIAQDNDFILYGISTNKLIFSSKSQEFRSSTEIEGINEELSCKHIDGEDFVCAMIIGNKINITYLNYHINREEYSYKAGYLKINSFDTLWPNLEIKNFDKLALYDTSINYLKFICGKHDNNVHNIRCLFFNAKNNDNNQNNIFYEKRIIFQNFYFSQNNCDFSGFNFEFLFC